jgi:hypothetical protein
VRHYNKNKIPGKAKEQLAYSWIIHPVMLVMFIDGLI